MISAKDFYDKFAAELQRNVKVAKETYPHNKTYTRFIINLIENAIKSFPPIQTSREYYRVDITGWTNEKGMLDDCGKPNLFAEHLWKLYVAVEHENTWKRWMDEVVKLWYINCPLRVVICYLPTNSEHAQFLQYVAAALNKLGVVQPLSSEFLLIIGNVEHINYVPYIWQGKQFIPQKWPPIKIP
jgi:hypothetical protein